MLRPLHLFTSPILDNFQTSIVSAMIVTTVATLDEQSVCCTVERSPMDAQQFAGFRHRITACWLYVRLKVNHCEPPSIPCVLVSLPE